MEKKIESYNGSVHSSPLAIRGEQGWATTAERNAFYWAIDKLKKEIPNLSTSEAVDEGIGREWFYTDDLGGIRVSEGADV